MKKAILGICSLLAVSSLNAQIVINEFAFDDTSTDNIEFVELYNAGGSTVDISGYIVRGDDTGTVGDWTATVPASTNLAAGAYYVVVGAAPTNGVPNTNQVANSSMQNSMEYIVVRDASNAILDSVVYERRLANQVIPAGIGEPAFDGVSATSGGGIWGLHTSVEAAVTNNTGFDLDGNPNATITLQRAPGGVDANNNDLDFHLAIATPGTANWSNGTVTPASIASGLTLNFDSADGTIQTALVGNFGSVYCQDPTVADTLTGTYPSLALNPSAIPASPQGGNVGVFWDATGGGNGAILNLTDVVTNVEFESYVYFPGPRVSESEDGTIITLRGKSDDTGDSTINALAARSQETGIRLRFENNTSNSLGALTVYCDQRINGTVTAFGSTTIPSAGWYRVLLHVNGSSVVAIIGGTHGNYTTDGSVTGSGQRLPASGTYTTTITRGGGAGMSYREGFATNSNARPLTYDQMVFRAPTAALPVELDSYMVD